MSIKRFRVKTAAMAGLAMLSVGGMAAAASGLAPASAGRAAPPATRTPGGQAAHARGNAAAATMTHGAPAAAGGADQIPAFCQADTGASSEPERQAAPPSRAPKTPPPASGPVERPDQGHGQGGPPTS
jgi:hypothetical protein